MMESDMGEEISFSTPELKLGLPKVESHGDMSDMSHGFGTARSASSDLALKEGSATSSSLASPSESESESEFYVKRRVIQEADHDDAGMEDKLTKFDGMKLNAMGDGSIVEKMKDDMYKNLLEKVAKYERELEVANKVIHTSQEEISRLKSELAESPTAARVSNNLHDQFEKSCYDVTEHQDDETMVLELQNKIARLEVSLQDSDQSNAMLIEELNRTKERLQISENEVSEFDHKLKTKIPEVTREMQHRIDSTNKIVRALEAELDSQRKTVSELQARIDAGENDLTNRDQEIQELYFALRTAHEKFSSERSCYLSDISVLSEQQKALQRELDQAELRAKLLEDQIGQRELEKLEMRDSLEAQEKRFLADVNQLKTELAQRCEQVDVLNKSFDASKFKYDMLMVEKDELTAKVDTLNAQANCESIQMKQMEARLIELEAERSKLLSKLEDGGRMVTELSLKVAKLENEAEMQRAMIFDRAEEKREAIRQLCFSLEYYRSEYHELCRAFTGLKRHPVMVSHS